MPDLPGTSATIRCAACGFENTTTSLYCQDCGLRLVAPPSSIAGESPPVPVEARAIPVRSSGRILSARRSRRVSSYFAATFWVLVVAAIAALASQVLRPPDDIPPADLPLTTEVANNVRAALQSSEQGGTPFDAPWSGQGLNAYLAAVLPPSAPRGPLHLAFQRALVAPAVGGFSLFVERKGAGLTFWTKIVYRLVSRSNGVGISPASVAIGHLPLPAWTSFVADIMNGDLASTLAPDLEILREAQRVRITAQKAAFDFSPPRS